MSFFLSNEELSVDANKRTQGVDTSDGQVNLFQQVRKISFIQILWRDVTL